VIATAVTDLVATASAGYQPVSVGSPSEVHLDAGAAADPAPPAPVLVARKTPGVQTRNDAADSGMAPSPSGAGGTGQSVGCVSPAELPPANLVVYLRTCPVRFELPAHVLALLDPPRG
jgi:hypothetical protein